MTTPVSSISPHAAQPERRGAVEPVCPARRDERAMSDRPCPSEPDRPLPYYLELERANREYRRAERDEFTPSSFPARLTACEPNGTSASAEIACVRRGRTEHALPAQNNAPAIALKTATASLTTVVRTRGSLVDITI